MRAIPRAGATAGRRTVPRDRYMSAGNRATRAPVRAGCRSAKPLFSGPRWSVPGWSGGRPETPSSWTAVAPWRPQSGPWRGPPTAWWRAPPGGFQSA